VGESAGMRISVGISFEGKAQLAVTSV
jgi:hypothetical protein